MYIPTINDCTLSRGTQQNNFIQKEMHSIEDNRQHGKFCERIGNGNKTNSTILFLAQAKIIFASGQLQDSFNHFTIAEERGCNAIDVCLSSVNAQKRPQSVGRKPVLKTT